MSNKTSDKNVAIIEELIQEYKTYNDLDGIQDLRPYIEALENILAEREQMTKRYEERDDELYERVKQCNNLQTEIDRLYLDKEELIELNRKQARQIQELEAKLEFKKFGDLDNVEFEEYMSQFIPKQVVIDKMKENKQILDETNNGDIRERLYIENDILQELLGGGK